MVVASWIHGIMIAMTIAMVVAVVVDAECAVDGRVVRRLQARAPGAAQRLGQRVRGRVQVADDRVQRAEARADAKGLRSTLGARRGENELNAARSSDTAARIRLELHHGARLEARVVAEQQRLVVDGKGEDDLRRREPCRGVGYAGRAVHARHGASARERRAAGVGRPRASETAARAGRAAEGAASARGGGGWGGSTRGGEGSEGE